MIFRLFCLWGLLISLHSFGASIDIEIPALSSQFTQVTAKLSCDNLETTKTLYYNGKSYRNIFVVVKPGLYKVEITIKLVSGEILSDWATGYIHSETEASKVSATINPGCFSTTLSVFWVSDTVINETDLYGTSVDSSLLKRIALNNIDSIASVFYYEGLKWYAEYDVHEELLDTNLIPLIKYSSGYFRNAITTCQTLLAFHNRYLKTGDPRDYIGFLNNANWLAENNHSGYYLNEFDFLHDGGTLLKKNWVSAMAQGYAVGSLSYAYYVTGNSMYMQEADSVFITLHQNSSDFWCFYVDTRGYYWLEEYPNEDFCHVLNGKMAALWGIFQYYSVSRNKLALALFEAGIKSVVDHFRIWSVNNSNRSYYCLHHNIKDHYHAVHQTQLLAFANKFNIDELYKACYCFINSTVVVEPQFITINCMPSTRDVTVESVQGWHIEEQSDWLSAEIIDNKIRITTGANQTNTMRTAKVDVVFDNCDRREINITQEMTDYFNLSTYNSVMDPCVDTLFLYYSTNVGDFEVTPQTDWLQIDKVNNALRLICKENQAFHSREEDFAIISDNMLLSEFVVNQKAIVPFINLEEDTVYLNTSDTYEIKVNTNIPDLTFYCFENWISGELNHDNLLIRATDVNRMGRVYLDSPYLTRELFVISGEFSGENGILSDAGYTVFPNPVRDVLNIRSKDAGPVDYNLKNVYGTTLQSGFIIESASIDVSGYKPGVYFVVFNTTSSAPYVVKIIIQ